MLSIFEELSVGVTYRAKICINEGRKKFLRLLCRGIFFHASPFFCTRKLTLWKLFYIDVPQGWNLPLILPNALYFLWSLKANESQIYIKRRFLLDLKLTLNTSFPKVKGYSLQELIFFQGPLSWWIASALIIPNPETLTSPSLSPCIYIKLSLSLDGFRI